MKKMLWAFRYFFYCFRSGHFNVKGYFGKPLFISGGQYLYLGNKVRVFPNSRIEIYQEKSIDSYVQIEENVSIGQSLHLICKGELVIGRDTVISSNVFISNVDHEYSELNTPILEQPLILQKTHIGSNCFIGYGAVIQAGTRLGHHCVVGSNSVVRGEFPDYSVLAGAPAKVIKKYDMALKEWVRV